MKVKVNSVYVVKLCIIIVKVFMGIKMPNFVPLTACRMAIFTVNMGIAM